MSPKNKKVPFDQFLEDLKQQGVTDIGVDAEGKVFGKIPLSQIKEADYDPAVFAMGGEKSFADFIHRCLLSMGVGTTPENNYVWDVKAMMSYFDPDQPDQFPIFKPGPGLFDVPVYVFFITRIAGRPFEWAAVAEAEDILRGCHLKYGQAWAQVYGSQVQKGILDKLADSGTEFKK